MWTITRQLQWPDGKKVVEISYGGLDYCNPDALCQKYDGEFQTYDDPVECVDVALEILKAWQEDSEDKIFIGLGNTGGFTMPFEPIGAKELKKWAQGARIEEKVK